MSENTNAAAFCVFINIFSGIPLSLESGKETVAPLLSPAPWLSGLGLSGGVNGYERKESGWRFRQLAFLLAQAPSTLAQAYSPAEHMGGKYRRFHVD